MAHTFKDSEGSEWSVRVSIGSLRRAVEIAGIDLLNLFGQEAEDGDDETTKEPPPIGRFFADFDALGRTIYAVVKPDADERGLSMDQFLDRLSGDAIEDGRRALLESCVDFYPSPAQRRAFRNIVAEVSRVYAVAIEEMEREASPERIRGAFGADTSRGHGGPSTNSQEASESTLTI